MGRTEVNVFLVAMAILPFLQNILLNALNIYIYIHTCMNQYIIFRQNFSDKNFRQRSFLHTKGHPNLHSRQGPFG